jgi:2-oxo-hept-3-ene-1,7-dioate hydratase
MADNAHLLWATTQQWASPPGELSKKIGAEESYPLQLELLSRWLVQGEKQLGWKIGASADGARKMMGLSSPISGYLLASREFPSGHAFKHSDIARPIIESELCVTLASEIQPDATRDQVIAAIGSIAPAFEIVDMRLNLREDILLGIADNCVQWAIVTGPAVPLPADLDLGSVRVEMKRNGEIVESALGRDVIDNQIDSLLWLAKHLSSHGQQLRAGHKIMTGTFTKPTPIAAGDHWETSFTAFGTVTASFS